MFLAVCTLCWHSEWSIGSAQNEMKNPVEVL
jgi:hypothetical protein